MNDRFFLDTNVLIYSLELNEPAKSVRAVDLIRYGVDTGKGVVSYQVVQEFLNVALRRFASTILQSDAQDYLRTVLSPMLRVHSSLELYAESLIWKSSHNLPWYDALILTAAMKAGCHTLYGEDFQHGQKFGGVRVVNPFL